MRLEIAVQDIEGARTAKQEGADRVELCAALGSTGGLTPSMGMVRACADQGLPMGVQVLIRPRGGSFVFDDEEKAVQLDDVRGAIEAGAQGVVVGGLLDDGTLDGAFAAELVDAARRAGEEVGRHVDVTFHRAFDVVPDRIEALERLIALGYDRILTSGGASSVPEGIESLRELCSQAAGRIQIQAGGGLTVEAVAMARQAGVDAVHASAKCLVSSQGGPGGGGDAPIERTDRAKVRALVRAVRAVPPVA